MAFIATQDKKISLGGKKKRKSDSLDFFDFNALMHVSLLLTQKLVQK